MIQWKKSNHYLRERMATIQFATLAGEIILFSVVVSGIFALVSKASDLETPASSDPAPPIGDDKSHESFPKDPVIF